MAFMATLRTTKNIIPMTLRELHNNDNSPWLIEGDLNEIVYHQEKSGGPQKNDSSLQSFRNSLDDCLLEDKVFWVPRLHGKAFVIVVELGKGLIISFAMMCLTSFFGNGNPFTLSSFDHRPIALNIFYQALIHQRRPKKNLFDLKSVGHLTINANPSFWNSVIGSRKETLHPL